MSLVRSALCGLAAGAAGTVALDLVWYVRYRRGGGTDSFFTWDFNSAPQSWADASAPARVGKLLFETATHHELSEKYIGLTTNIMHWAYGSQWGVVLGLADGSSSRVRAIQAPLLGALVWLSSYVSLPIAGFYKPIWSYDRKTLWQDLSPHLAYGAGAVATFSLVCKS